MFTALFGKRKSSPVEDETPPIPGPKSEDGFVVVEPYPSGGIYPNVSGIGGAYPLRPAPAAPRLPVRTQHPETTFHYLQGVPFLLSRELQMSAHKDTFAAQIGDLLAFLSNKINISNCEYDFSLERSVLKEC